MSSSVQPKLAAYDLFPFGSGWCDFVDSSLPSSDPSSPLLSPCISSPLDASPCVPSVSHPFATVNSFPHRAPPPPPPELLTPALLAYYFHQYPHLFQIPKATPSSKSATKRPLPTDSNLDEPATKRRPTRPKVVEAKGGVQCIGRNRKKSIQCRNAALMEYIGVRPQYCAEHIELDPASLYIKCRSPYQKEPGDNKGCKEVVLKEFRFCYKHFPDCLADLVRTNDTARIHQHAARISEILLQLEREACAAKKVDSDLYQRKNKLIPKFAEMKKLVGRCVDSMLASPHLVRPHQFDTTSGTTASAFALTAPAVCSPPSPLGSLIPSGSPPLAAASLGFCADWPSDSDLDFTASGSEDEGFGCSHEQGIGCMGMAGVRADSGSFLFDFAQDEPLSVPLPLSALDPVF